MTCACFSLGEKHQQAVGVEVEGSGDTTQGKKDGCVFF